jgi:hypothetical protein
MLFTTWLVWHIQVPSILVTSNLNFMSLVCGPSMLIFSEIMNIWVPNLQIINCTWNSPNTCNKHKCRIWDSQGGEYEDGCLLACSAV